MNQRSYPGTLYDVMPSNANPNAHNAMFRHPWPQNMSVTSGLTDNPKQFLMDNKLYIAGGAAVLVGLLAWKKGWFR